MWASACILLQELRFLSENHNISLDTGTGRVARKSEDLECLARSQSEIAYARLKIHVPLSIGIRSLIPTLIGRRILKIM